MSHLGRHARAAFHPGVDAAFAIPTEGGEALDRRAPRRRGRRALSAARPGLARAAGGTIVAATILLIGSFLGPALTTALHPSRTAPQNGTRGELDPAPLRGSDAAGGAPWGVTGRSSSAATPIANGSSAPSGNLGTPPHRPGRAFGLGNATTRNAESPGNSSNPWPIPSSTSWGTSSAGVASGATRPAPSATNPTFGFLERTYTLTGFNPLKGYLANLGGQNGQVPTLVSSPGTPNGIYYVDNASHFDVLYLANGTIRSLATVVPLYQTYSGYDEMLDNEFFLEYGYDEALFFGTTTANRTTYSIELVNLTSGGSRIWNTSAAVDSTNQQPDYVGNNTVIVMSSNCSIWAFNLAAHRSWKAGTLGANFSSGSTCFEANNVYYFFQKGQLLNVEAHGDTGDGVEQLNSSVDALGRIHFASVATIAVDSGVVFNWVNGLAYNGSTDTLGFTAGYWAAPSVYTYLVPYNAKGLITTTGLQRATVENRTGWSARMLDIQRYVYTSDFTLGRSFGPNFWTNGTQYMYDPWNGSTPLANRSIDNGPCANSCFEGTYGPSSDYYLDYNATLTLNFPMYRVVYAYHQASHPLPPATPALTLLPDRGPSGTRAVLDGVGFLPRTLYTYCYRASVGACANGSTVRSLDDGSLPVGTSLLIRSNTSGYIDVSEGAIGIADASFTLTFANLSLSASSGPAGYPLTLSGDGYAPNASYSYCFNASATACATGPQFLADALGRIPSGGANLTVPNSTAVGRYFVDVSSGAALVASAPFTVDTNLTALLFPSENATDVGRNVTFQALALGGSPPYSAYRFDFGDGTSQSGTNRSATHAYTNSSAFVVRLTVVDANGTNASVTEVESVHLPPVSSPPTSSRSSADVGQNVTFSATARLGTLPYLRYSWSGLPANCTGRTSSGPVCTFASAGNLTIRVNVTDAVGITSPTNGSLNLTIDGDPTVGTPTANRSSVDLGQNVTFRASASQGSGGYTFAWTGLPAGCSGASASISCTPTAVATSSIRVTVNDSNGFAITSSALSFTVHADPTASTPTASPSAVDVGQNTTLSVTASLGSGGYSYAWAGLPSGCSSTSASFRCAPSQSGTFTIRATATDSDGWAVTSAALTLTVSNDPTVSTPSANRSSVDVGQSVTFTASTTAGSGGLSYLWIGLPTGCGSTGPSAACTPSGNGTFTIHLEISDSNGFTVESAGLTYTVDPNPTVSAPSADRPTVDVGQWVNLSASTTPGSGGLTYRWTGLPSGCASISALVRCAPTASGAYRVSLTVVDSNGFSATSGALAFRVYDDPSVTTPVANRTTLDLGQPVHLSANATPGSGGLSYTWTGLPPGCVATIPSFACVPTATGDYRIGIVVTDSNGFSVTNGTLLLSISDDPTVAASSAPNASADVGQSVTFTATPLGGLAPYSYRWQGLPTGCASSAASATCGDLAANGTFRIQVVVTDANGYGVESPPIDFTVYADPVPTTPTANRSSADVGQSVTFVTSATNGSGGLRVQWIGLPDGCTSTLTTFRCVVAAPGNFTVSVRVTDSNGMAVDSAALRFAVYSDPSVLAPAATPSALDVHQGLSLSVSPTGGLAPYSFAWSGLPATCASASASVHCTPSIAGTYVIGVRVTDANGVSVASGATQVVVAPPLTANVVLPPTSLWAGQTWTFLLNASGGTGPWTYTWRFGDGALGIGTTVDHAFGAPGNYTVHLWVNDSTGVSIERSFYVLVLPRPAPTLAGLPYWAWGVLAGLGLVAGLAAILVRRRRHATRNPEPPTESEALEPDDLGARFPEEGADPRASSVDGPPGGPDSSE